MVRGPMVLFLEEMLLLVLPFQVAVMARGIRGVATATGMSVVPARAAGRLRVQEGQGI